MNGIDRINALGYMIQDVHQQSPRDWVVYFRSPFEFKYWHAEGTSFEAAAKNAARLARGMGPALEASLAYRARVAARFAKDRVRLEPRRKRVKL